jgi:hypothetical protein
VKSVNPHTKAIAVIAFVSLFAVGCGLMDDSMDSLDAPALLSVYPVDGDSLVPADTTCYLVFDGPMDRSSCERNFHLYHGEDSHADSLLDGRFHWSAEGDTMFFDPSDEMRHDSDYTVHLNDGMMGTGGHQMMIGENFFHGFGGGLGHGMMGSGEDVSSGEWHFRTAH